MNNKKYLAGIIAMLFILTTISMAFAAGNLNLDVPTQPNLTTGQLSTLNGLLKPYFTAIWIVLFFLGAGLVFGGVRFGSQLYAAGDDQDKRKAAMTKFMFMVIGFIVAVAAPAIAVAIIQIFG